MSDSVIRCSSCLETAKQQRRHARLLQDMQRQIDELKDQSDNTEEMVAGDLHEVDIDAEADRAQIDELASRLDGAMDALAVATRRIEELEKRVFFARVSRYAKRR